MKITTSQIYVIVSKAELAISEDDEGFWNEELGWVGLSDATHYNSKKDVTLHPPQVMGEYAQWMTLDEANAEYGELQPEIVRVRLCLDVTYALNGESADSMQRLLRRMCISAIENGMLTGATDSEVEDYSVNTVEVMETPTKDEIAEFILDRIENGEFDLEGLPNRVARYGLMEPNEFADEMRERMDSLKCE